MAEQEFLLGNVRGPEGLGIWTTETQLAYGGGTTSVNVAAVVGRALKAGDLVISTHASSPGVMHRVTTAGSAGSASTTTAYVGNIRGATGTWQSSGGCYYDDQLIYFVTTAIYPIPAEQDVYANQVLNPMPSRGIFKISEDRNGVAVSLHPDTLGNIGISTNSYSDRLPVVYIGSLRGPAGAAGGASVWTTGDGLSPGLNSIALAHNGNAKIGDIVAGTYPGEELVGVVTAVLNPSEVTVRC